MGKRYIKHALLGMTLIICILLTGCGAIKIGNQFGILSNYEQFDFEGIGEIDSNPWGITCGLIEAGEEQRVLLTPGTALVLRDIKAYDSFPFYYQIFSELTDSNENSSADSDGAGLSVTYYDAEGNVLREDAIFIDFRAEEHSYVTVPQTVFSSYVNAIKIQCNAGYYGDATFDWVILH